MQTGLPPFQKTTLQELEQVAPELYPLVLSAQPAGFEADEEDDEESEADGNIPFLYFPADTLLTGQQYRKLKEDHGFYTPWAVNGHLEIVGGECSGPVVVKGDLRCDVFSYGEGGLVQGKIVARHYASFIAEDHEGLQSTVPLRLETPYVFAWFYDLGKVETAESTCIFVVCDGASLRSMQLKSPYFFWKEFAFVLRPELTYAVESDYSDAIHWNFSAISSALRNGEPLLIEGFDPACMPLYRKAAGEMNRKQFRESYGTAKQAAELSPGFYYPRHYMGYNLYHVSAFAQAIPHLTAAVKLFPAKHKNLQNQAADYLALSYLRLGNLEAAFEWSHFSIASTIDNRDDNRRWFSLRIRAEASLIAGDPKAALADLEAAVNLKFDAGSAQWLLGLAYYQLGDPGNAEKHRRLAAKTDAKFDVGYTSYQNTHFIQSLPATVNWD